MKKKVLIWVAIVFSLLFFIALILTPVYQKKPVLKLRPLVKGKIAIVIDDWGYSLTNLSVVEKIKQPLTCAILPNLKNSSLVARELKSYGFEIILHLPMQPKERFKLEKNTVTLDMKERRVLDILDKDLTSVKFAKGVSNHMGSAITEDKRISRIIMSEVKKRKMYFLDSFVTADSVCPEIAEKLQVRFAKRDIFLDNQNDPGYIKGQLLKLRDLAKRHGWAIGIGHDRKNTLTALKDLIPQLVKEGYKFVFVSELAR